MAAVGRPGVGVQSATAGQTVGRLNALVDGRQRLAGSVADQQAGVQIVADFLGLPQHHRVVLGRMGAAVEVRPVVDGEDIVVAGGGYGLAGGVQQGLGENLGRQPRIVVETPGGHGGRPGGGRFGQDAQAGGGSLRLPRVLRDELTIALL
jgi:threonine dehydratase